MSITEQITADQQAVADAQTALDAANAKLAADQAALDALQPHLSLWQEIEAHAIKWGGEAEAELMSIVARGRALLGV